MTTLIVDGSLHVSAFPATYTGPGTLIGNCVQSAGDEADVHGYFTSVTGDTVQVNCGFQPLSIVVFNTTDSIKWEWQHGFAATNTVKTAFSGPTIAIDTGSAIVVSADPDLAGNAIVTFSTTLCGAAKNICFHIQG